MRFVPNIVLVRRTLVGRRMRLLVRSEEPESLVLVTVSTVWRRSRNLTNWASPGGSVEQQVNSDLSLALSVGSRGSSTTMTSCPKVQIPPMCQVIFSINCINLSQISVTGSRLNSSQCAVNRQDYSCCIMPLEFSHTQNMNHWNRASSQLVLGN